MPWWPIDREFGWNSIIGNVFGVGGKARCWVCVIFLASCCCSGGRWRAVATKQRSLGQCSSLCLASPCVLKLLWLWCRSCDRWSQYLWRKSIVGGMRKYLYHVDANIITSTSSEWIVSQCVPDLLNQLDRILCYTIHPCLVGQRFQDKGSKLYKLLDQYINHWLYIWRTKCLHLNAFWRLTIQKVSQKSLELRCN